ncbi:hypothetical protein NQ317_011796 [Molorchus minor]|uniref:Uncharacterized protein n=1 Tax=Molorchus minor TaxID=1323400 RepID=A0ABQ9J6T7_9CUCU|nr:hypothetical protein NQ317_011796 [Molorchus minor]
MRQDYRNMDAEICIPCLQSLKWYANIASICEATEEKIIRCCEQENTNRRGLVELGLNLSCKDNVEYANVFNPIETKKEAPDCKEIHVEDEKTTQKS